MRNYIERFKRGYAWEKEFGATTPMLRAGLSLMFAASWIAFSAFSHLIAPLIFSGVFTIMLIALWVHTTVDGAKWADAEDKRTI